ncbi:MAG: hypothetical protein ACE5IW_08085 [bacterium]
MIEEGQEHDFIGDMCPFLYLPCPRGKEAALECCRRYQGDFDPMVSFRDFSVLGCATARAARMRGATVKYLY